MQTLIMSQHWQHRIASIPCVARARAEGGVYYIILYYIIL